MNLQLRYSGIGSSVLIHSSIHSKDIYGGSGTLLINQEYCCEQDAPKEDKKQRLTYNRIHIVMEEIESTVFRSYLVWIRDIRK